MKTRKRKPAPKRVPLKKGYKLRQGRQQGIGGALLTLGKNIASGKKLGSGALKGVLRAGVTPGSGISAGAGLAGELLKKSKKPGLQKLGNVASAAGNIAGMVTGGGGGGGLGKLAKGAMGALTGGGGGAAGGLGALAKGAMGALGGGGAAAGGQQGGGIGGKLLKGALGALTGEEGMRVPMAEGGLVGGQKKLDKNNDGKISGDDFKMLRSMMEGGVVDYEHGGEVDYGQGGMVNYQAGGAVPVDPGAGGSAPVQPAPQGGGAPAAPAPDPSAAAGADPAAAAAGAATPPAGGAAPAPGGGGGGLFGGKGGGGFGKRLLKGVLTGGMSEVGRALKKQGSGGLVSYQAGGAIPVDPAAAAAAPAAGAAPNPAAGAAPDPTAGAAPAAPGGAAPGAAAPAPGGAAGAKKGGLGGFLKKALNPAAAIAEKLGAKPGGAVSKILNPLQMLKKGQDGMRVSMEHGGRVHNQQLMDNLSNDTRRLRLLKKKDFIKFNEGGRVTGDGDPTKEGSEDEPRMMGGTEILGGDPIEGDLLSVRMPSETTQRMAGLPDIGYGERYTEEGEEEEALEERKEERLKELIRKGPSLIKRDVDKDLKGDVKDIPEGEPMDSPNNMRLVIDPSDFKQGIYKNYTKTMGVKMINPETGKEEYYYAPSARGTKSRGGEDNFKTFDDLPEELRDQAMRMFEDSEKDFLKKSDNYAKRRGFQKVKASFDYGGKVYVR